MSRALNVLLIEDNASDCALAVRMLERGGFSVQWRRIETEPEMREALAAQPWDVIISDYQMPRFNGPAALKILQDHDLDIPFIVVSGTVGEDVAVTMMKAGSQDYLMKGVLTRLVPAVERELLEARNRRERRQALAAVGSAVAQLSATLESTADGIAVIGADRRITRFNQRFITMWQITTPDESGISFNAFMDRMLEQCVDPEGCAELTERIDQSDQDGAQQEIALRDGRFFEHFSRAYVLDGRTAGRVWSFRDITTRRRAELWQENFNTVLSLITAEAPLQLVLERIAQFTERTMPGALCAIHLLSADGKHLQHGAAPSLPTFYWQALDGAEIGDDVGSCGAAASTGTTVVVTDIQTHPNWAPFRDLVRRADLHSCWSHPVLSAEGAVLGTFAIYRRIVGSPDHEEIERIAQVARLSAVAIERSRHQQALRLARVVFEQSADAIMVTSADGQIVTVNPAFIRITGYDESELIGNPASVFDAGHHEQAFYQHDRASTTDDGQWQGEVLCRLKNGAVLPLLMSVACVRNAAGKIVQYISIMSDLSEQKNQAARIEQLAFYDELTGLPNRALFMDRLKQIVATAHRKSQHGAMLFLDLDRFKEINDSKGHAVGDLALVEVARRFSACARQHEALARLGGDEFVLVAENAGEIEAAAIAERLHASLLKPLQIKSFSFAVRTSIGIVLFPGDGDNAEDLLKRADIAMYRAKNRGEPYCFYQATMGADLEKRLHIATRLGLALAANGLQLFYQPKVDLGSGALVGAEALLRWHDEDWGWVSPVEFIPIAEERGMMGVLGDWVLACACEQLQRWRAQGISFPGRLAVNLSATQFRAVDIAERMGRIVSDAGLSPAMFDLELTESSMLADPDSAVTTMRKLVGAGFTMSIDDFGTGYSSLAYIKRFSAHHLKIDISFVRDMLTDREDHAIVTAIIALAHSLGLQTIAEGVEQPDQADALRAMGCDSAQGYHFGHPLPADEFASRWLR